MLRPENTCGGIQRKNDGGDGPTSLPSKAIGVAVQLSLTPRIFCAVLVAGITLGTPVFAQRYVEVERSFAVALIRDVLIAID